MKSYFSNTVFKDRMQSVRTARKLFQQKNFLTSVPQSTWLSPNSYFAYKRMWILCCFLVVEPSYPRDWEQSHPFPERKAFFLIIWGRALSRFGTTSVSRKREVMLHSENTFPFQSEKDWHGHQIFFFVRKKKWPNEWAVVTDYPFWLFIW